MKRTCFAFPILALAMALGCSSPSPSADAGASKKESSVNVIVVSAAEQQAAGIRVAALAMRSVPRELAVPGKLTLDDEHTVHIASYADGKVVDVLKNVGDLVRPGMLLARLHSHSVHETAGALAQDFANVARAQAALGYAQQKRERYQHLYAIQAASLEQEQGSEQELIQAKTDLANASAAVTMEREHLADLLQVRADSITPANLYDRELVPLTSPIAGTIVLRSVTQGMVLEPGAEAYVVSDLTRLWMIASVNEADLSQLHIGEHATVRSLAWPDQTFSGIVSLIGSTLDPATRAVQVRISIPNAAHKLKPEMYTSATLDEPERRAALFVPEEALQDINGIQVVFVTPDGIHFTPQPIKGLSPVAGQVEVSSGLRAGDRIAIAGAFMLKSDLLKGSIGDE